MSLKHLFIVALLVCGLTKGYSQTTTAQILARAERAISATPSGEANFTSAYLDSRGRVQSKVSGVMYLEGDKFRLVYGDIIAVYKPKTLSYHDAQENTLTISEPSTDELIQINPLHFLRAKAKGFSASEPVKRGGIISVVFTPEQKRGIKQIIINFVEKTSLPSVVSIVAKDGSKVVVTVNGFRGVKTHPQGFFELSPKQFPKSEVIDLR